MSRSKLNIKPFKKEDITEVVDIIHSTIKICYPAIYQPEVVDFFLEYHSKQSILDRSEKGELYTLHVDNKLIGTIYFVDTEFGGLYILPEFQKMGYGGESIKFLLKRAKSQGFKKVWLDATPGSKSLYVRLGFKLIEERIMFVENDIPLPYTYMEYKFGS